jgi:predicted outer membrane repeat protein
VFNSNQAQLGGALSIAGVDAFVELISVVLASNTALAGGAVYSSGGIQLNMTTLINNMASSQGYTHMIIAAVCKP